MFVGRTCVTATVTAALHATEKRAVRP